MLIKICALFSVPTAVGNITAIPQSPSSIGIMWPAPILPNGPLDKIEYYIRWTTQTKDGISKDMMTEAIKYEARDLYNNGLFSRTIDNLSPSHMYSVQVGSHSLTASDQGLHCLLQECPIKI